MAGIFETLEEAQSLKRVRIFLLCSCLCSMLFYYLMTSLDSSYVDYLPGRVAISVLAFFSLLITFCVKNRLKWSRFFLRCCTISFILLYLYLLKLNHWSTFHCWSYFVVTSIICSTAMTWESYLIHAALGIIGPIVLSFFSPMTFLQILHFHSANIASFSIIGIAVHSTFQYKKEVEKLTNDLIDQSKMAALGEMAGGVAHEINNPLAIIQGSIEQLERLPLKSPEDQEKFKNLSDKISRMVVRITKITSSLKDFAHSSDQEDMQWHNLNELIEDGISLSHQKFKSMDAVVHFTPLSDNPMVKCKSNQIIQVIFNLCSNSFEATKSIAHPRIEVTLKRDKSHYVIAVSDNGEGISSENSKKVMEPFFTTKDIGKGLGLGLSVSHGIAKLHGGDLVLKQENEHKCFVLTLPIQE